MPVNSPGGQSIVGNRKANSQMGIHRPDRRGRSDAPIHDLGASPLGKDLSVSVEVNGVSHQIFFVVDVLTPKGRRSRSIFRVDEVY